MQGLKGFTNTTLISFDKGKKQIAYLISWSKVTISTMALEGPKMDVI